MTRQTSIEAFHQNRDILSLRRWQVYEILFKHGPMTANQVIEKFRKLHHMLNTGAVTTRLSELRLVGVVTEIGTVSDPITGNNVIQWDVTDRVAIKLEKPKRIKCDHCEGKGYFQEQQARLF